MSVKEILSGINALPKIGGSVLCTFTGKIIGKEISPYLWDYTEKVLSHKIEALIRQFHVFEEEFEDLDVADTGYKWIAKRHKTLMLVVLLYPKGDPHLVKLHMDLAFEELFQDKESHKILFQNIGVLIATSKQVHILDLIKFRDCLKTDNLERGIIISKYPYKDRIKKELSKNGYGIEIVIADDIKEEQRNLTKILEAHGYIVKKIELLSQRWF